LTHDDLPYFIDLQLFLSRQVIVGNRSQLDYTKDLIAGCIPRDEVQMDVEWITAQHESSTDLINQQQVVVNANKQFRKTRPKAAPASYKRAKELDRSTHLFNTVHPLLSTLQQTVPAERSNLLSSIANFRPRETIFEIGQRGTHKNNEAAQIVRKRRSAVEHVVQSSKKLKTTPAAVSIEEDVKTFKDEEYYMSHFPQDHNTEQGYAVSKNESFMENAQKVSMDLVDDERSKKKAASSGLHWDVKKKKFVRGDGTGSDNKKIIRTESGAKISASFQSGRFKDWQKKSKLSLPRVGEEELKLPTRMLARRRYQHTMNTPAKELDKKSMGYEKAQRKQRQQPAKSELRNVQEIRKGREQKEKRRAKTGRHKKQKGKGGRRR
jgi:ATP-dependent RNA helicase DDX54/DBP10